MEQKLTDDQKRLIEQNHHLVYSFLNSRYLNIEEWYDVAIFGLIKAAMVYEPEKGKFSTIAYYWMQFYVTSEYKQQNLVKKRIPKSNILSLNNKRIYDDKNEEYIDIFEESAPDISDEVIHKITCEEIINHCKKEKERKVCKMLLEGYNIADIERTTKINRPTIYRYKAKLIKYIGKEIAY